MSGRVRREEWVRERMEAARFKDREFYFIEIGIFVRILVFILGKMV